MSELAHLVSGFTLFGLVGGSSAVILNQVKGIFDDRRERRDSVGPFARQAHSASPSKVPDSSERAEQKNFGAAATSPANLSPAQVEESRDIPDGFTAWIDTGQRFTGDTRVEVMFRSGRIAKHTAAELRNFWDTRNEITDIIAYRILQAPSEDGQKCEHDFSITALPPMGARMHCDKCDAYMGTVVPNIYGKPDLKWIGSDAAPRSKASGTQAIEDSPGGLRMDQTNPPSTCPNCSKPKDRYGDRTCDCSPEQIAKALGVEKKTERKPRSTKNSNSSKAAQGQKPASLKRSLRPPANPSPKPAGAGAGRNSKTRGKAQ